MPWSTARSGSTIGAIATILGGIGQQVGRHETQQAPQRLHAGVGLLLDEPRHGLPR